MVFALMLLAGMAAAQPVQQIETVTTATLMTEAVSTTSDGHASRCEMNFIAIARDDVDKPGRVVGVRGTFGLEVAPGSPPFELVKLSYRDIDGDHLGPWQAPSSVSLVGTDGVSNVARRGSQFLGEDNNSLVAGFHLSKNDTVTAQLTKGHRLKMLFNRQPGYSDVSVDVDLTVLDSDGDKVRWGGDTLQKFAVCSVKLLNEGLAALDERHRQDLLDGK